MSTGQATFFMLIERPIYGSSRLGIDNTPLELIGYTAPTSGITTYELGLKQYEFSNLPIAIGMGNVLTTVSDKKIPHTTNGTDIDYYLADITSATDSAECYFETYQNKVQNIHWRMPISNSLEFDKSELLRIHNRYYYPFGSPMDGRTFSSDKYRFGFNGHEKDDEISGEGNHLSFANYGYDTRLGRRWQLDPVPKADVNNYSAFSNNPIVFIDPKGTTDIYYLGTRIGNDGVSNNLVASTNSFRVASKVLLSMLIHKKYQIPDVKNGLKTDKFFVINRDILNRAFDVLLLAIKNPKREHGVAMKDNGDNHFKNVTDIQEGKDIKDDEKGYVEFSLKNATVSIHNHTLRVFFKNNKTISSSAYEPSKPDPQNPNAPHDYDAFKKCDMNIIVGGLGNESATETNGKVTLGGRDIGIVIYGNNPEADDNSRKYTFSASEAKKILKRTEDIKQ